MSKAEHPFDELIDQIETMVERFHERITPEDDEEEKAEKAEEHPVIAYQYQKGLLTAFALVRNVINNLKPLDDADSMWMVRDWIESIHRQCGECDPYLRAVHASEEDAMDICYKAFLHLKEEFGCPEEDDEE